MASGFFLGGAAEGMESAAKQTLARDTLTADTDIRNRGLAIQDRAQTLAENNATRAANQSVMERVDKQVSDTMAIVAETVKSAQAVNADRATVEKAITPLVQSAKSLYAKAGGDPAALDARVGALFVSPTGTQTAAASTESEAAKARGKARGEIEGKIDGAKARGAASLGPEFEKDKVSAENTLRDDYMKASNAYTTIRDAKNRLDNIEKTGAGDIALLFQYMKILDPGSTVREGEFATAGSVAGVPGQIEALRKQIVGGGRLADSARNQILSQSNKLYEAAAKQHDKTTTQFANTAKRQGLNVDNVIIDLSPGAPIPVAGRTPTGLNFRATK